MLLKPGVKIQGIQPETVLAIFEAQRIFDIEQETLVITSVMDGKHSRNSKHKIGYAFDLRTRTMTNPIKKRIASALRVALGDEYFVLLEDIDGINQHIHVQFTGSEL